VSSSPAVEPLLPVRLGKAGIHFAQGMRAGPWVFATGVMAQDFGRGLAEGIVRPRHPHAGPSKRAREAALIFDHLAAVLAAGGSDYAHIVRTDQYYTTVDAVPPYQEARRARFGARIPPSTSIAAMAGFALPGAEINLQAIAVARDGGLAVEHLADEFLNSRPTSGYSPALAVGDFVFVPGATAQPQQGEPARGGIPTAAQIEEGMQWGGARIKLEAGFLIERRIAPALALAGCTLADVVKAQVYLSRIADFAPFTEVWAKHFPADPPALSLIPCGPHSLAPADGRLEINVIALRPAARARRKQIDAGVVPAFHGQPQAVRAGDLLLLSGLMAVDADGLAPAAAVDPAQPHYQSSIETQAERILDAAEALCAAAGTTLANVVRIQQFHNDIADVYPVWQAWRRRLGDAPLPFTAVAVPDPLPVPGATLLMDLWVYAP
jgi:enamine deaminase RidA (YjgF/YER057c/UK114 family)